MECQHVRDDRRAAASGDASDHDRRPSRQRRGHRLHRRQLPPRRPRPRPSPVRQHDRRLVGRRQASRVHLGRRSHSRAPSGTVARDGREVRGQGGSSSGGRPFGLCPTPTWAASDRPHGLLRTRVAAHHHLTATSRCLSLTPGRDRASPYTDRSPHGRAVAGTPDGARDRPSGEPRHP